MINKRSSLQWSRVLSHECFQYLTFLRIFTAYSF